MKDIVVFLKKCDTFMCLNSDRLWKIPKFSTGHIYVASKFTLLFSQATSFGCV